MDLSNFSQHLPLLKKYAVPLLLLGVGLIALVGSMIALLPQKQDISATVDDSGITTTVMPTKMSDITIDVEGAVQHPGLYQIIPEARINDAIKAAGGIGSGADSEWLTKHLNLASKLTDGQKLYIPHNGESVAGVQTDTQASSDNSININSASASELDSLPGIGQITALKIISNRPYHDIQDLISKKVVNSKVFGEIKDKISL